MNVLYGCSPIQVNPCDPLPDFKWVVEWRDRQEVLDEIEKLKKENRALKRKIKKLQQDKNAEK